MILQSDGFTNTRRRALLAATALLLVVAACGDEGDPVDPNQRLCNGETGLGLLIEGRADPVEFCVDDEDVSAFVTIVDRYDVAAQITAPEGDFVVHMVFAVRSFPATLHITPSLSEAIADPAAVFLYYQEIPDGGGPPIESFAIDKGTFTLSFVDADVATGTLSGVVFDMRNVTTGDPAGQREFSEGMFSISSKDPTAATVTVR
jgi:hypothetical protein